MRDRRSASSGPSRSRLIIYARKAAIFTGNPTGRATVWPAPPHPDNSTFFSQVRSLLCRPVSGINTVTRDQEGCSMRRATACGLVVGVLAVLAAIPSSAGAAEGFWTTIATGAAGAAEPSDYTEFWFESPHGPPLAVTHAYGDHGAGRDGRRNDFLLAGRHAGTSPHERRLRDAHQPRCGQRFGRTCRSSPTSRCPRARPHGPARPDGIELVDRVEG